MIEAREHFYTDDPSVGPPDVRTRLRDASYFFLGNGFIQAAVQYAPGGEGTPLGLLIMDPEVLGPKRAALTMHPELGLEPTLIEVVAGGVAYRPAAESVRVEWETSPGSPVVRADWRAGALDVRERFFCPDSVRPILVRSFVLKSSGRDTVKAVLRTGAENAFLERTIEVPPDGTARSFLVYTLNPAARTVSAAWGENPAVGGHFINDFGEILTGAVTGEPRLDRFFRAAKDQLPAVISGSGRLDGSIWQYNREWVRDQSSVVEALAALGSRDRSRTMLERLLSRFVADEGDTFDSSERRAPDEIELDQNGYLLRAVLRYALWTGDVGIARRHWPRIRALAEFPLRDVFRHRPSGLLMNRREYWERHRIHGIRTGLELAHQVWVTAGLEAAAALARLTGRPEEASRWTAESGRLRRAWLEDGVFRMADNRGFIKRRDPAGPVQETIEADADAGLPDGVPLRAPGPHFLNPDTSAALPLLLGLLPPDSPLGTLTLDSLETLWNQAWTGGGFGRYHFTSEPDSVGPWPFASLFAARAAVECGRFDIVRKVLDWLDSVPGSAAGSWFEFYGRRPSPPFPQVGVIPWTWAEMILLVVDHILGLRPTEAGLLIRPRLLPGAGPARADLAMRGVRVGLDICPAAGRGPLTFETEAEVLERTETSVLIAYPRRDVSVRVR